MDRLYPYWCINGLVFINIRFYIFLFRLDSEEWHECAARETLEETGLCIKNISFATVVNSILKENNYHYTTIFMKAEVDKNTEPTEPINKEPDKCEGISWVLQYINIFLSIWITFNLDICWSSLDLTLDLICFIKPFIFILIHF